jgi:hypothetical protein
MEIKAVGAMNVGRVGQEAKLFQLGLNEEEILIFYAALEHYQAGLKRDMETGYGGSEKYSTEDDMFLGSQISKVSKMMYELTENEDTKRAALVP